MADAKLSELLNELTSFADDDRYYVVQSGAQFYQELLTLAAAIQSRLGALLGPASATDGHVVLFDGTSGKLAKDGGAVSSLAVGTAAALATARTIGGVSFDGTANITQPFDVFAYLPGLQTSASQKLLRVKMARAVSFAANFAGSYFTATANATGSTVFDVQKNGVSVGTVTIGAGSTTATFASSGGAAQAFAAGDVLTILGPATADATLADPAFTLAGTR